MAQLQIHVSEGTVYDVSSPDPHLLKNLEVVVFYHDVDGTEDDLIPVYTNQGNRVEMLGVVNEPIRPATYFLEE